MIKSRRKEEKREKRKEREEKRKMEGRIKTSQRI